MMQPQIQRLVAIDIGNSHLSAQLFTWNGEADPLPAEVDSSITGGLEHAKIRLAHQAFPGSDWQPIVDNWASQGDLKWFISSVHRPFQDCLLQWLSAQRAEERVEVLGHQDLPLSIDVSHPEQVGMDRLAAAVAVNQRRSADRPALVVDCGSAVTCDLVSAAGVFLGGAILPGWHLATQALANQTDQLPQISWTEPPTEVLGKSTEAAIVSGVYWGTLGALRELVSQLSQPLETVPEKFLTGAGSIWTGPLIADEFKVVSDLVLTGVALSGADLLNRERAQQNG